MLRPRFLTPALLCLTMQSLSAVFAADPAPPAAVPAPAAAPSAPANTPAYIGAAIYRGSTPAVSTAAQTPGPESPQDEFQKRLQQDRERKRQQEIEYANRPNEWQLQNPSGPQNRSTVDPRPAGYVAPNTYFGPQYRNWSQLSAPVYERTLPPNMTPVPPLTQTNVMVAPYSYWGADNQHWLQMSPGGATQSGLGGWNYRVGW